MIKKRILSSGRIRRINGGFSFIPHRFLTDGFLSALNPPEQLLYFFLVLAADRNGLSFYSYDSICNLLKMSLDQYIKARDALIQTDLIDFDGTIFQVLELPQAGMIDRQTVFEIHRLHNLGFTERKIARELRLSRPTVKKYIENPEPTRQRKISRSSKLDAYRDQIKAFLEQDPEVKAPVVLQRIEKEGFDGKVTIVRDYLKKLRGQQKYRTAFIRFESRPGQQMQIDWGHFECLAYKETMRKLYAFAAIECYSRTAYVEFTHSQNQQCLHQALLNAYAYFDA